MRKHWSLNWRFLWVMKNLICLLLIQPWYLHILIFISLSCYGHSQLEIISIQKRKMNQRLKINLISIWYHINNYFPKMFQYWPIIKSPIKWEMIERRTPERWLGNKSLNIIVTSVIFIFSPENILFLISSTLEDFA